jgi:hypothetical protein
MSEDILHTLRIQQPGLSLYFSENIYNRALQLLEDMCLSMSGKSLQLLGLSSPTRELPTNQLCAEILRKTNYSIEDLALHVSINEPLLVPDQTAAYNAILQHVGENKGSIFFHDTPGGTSKTFILNLLLAKILQRKKIALAVASSEIASTLLRGGKTVHSAFKLPLYLAHGDHPVCDILKGSGQAKVLQQCTAIIWDKCTMAHKKALQALHHMLQDLRGNNELMEGSTVILDGDFRQILPIIPRSTPADEINACFKASHLWRYMKRFTLTTNMRVHLTGDASAATFSKQLLMLDDGKSPPDPNTGLIQFPHNFCNNVCSVDELKANMFPDIHHNYRQHEWLCERAILAPKNDCIHILNLQI